MEMVIIVRVMDGLTVNLGAILALLSLKIGKKR
jgi:hypothetical protein